jgi:uncharacterized protein (DUF2141 family)
LNNPAPSQFRVTASTVVVWTLALCAHPAAASAPATSSATQPAAQLTIRVTRLRNHKGQLIFGVFKSANNGFPSESAKSVNWQTKAADTNTVTFTASLPPGAY